MHVGWPQGIWIAFAVLGLIIGAALDGEPRTGKHKFAPSLVSIGLTFGLLYWGGFFA